MRRYIVRNIKYKENQRHLEEFLVYWRMNKAATTIQKRARGMLGRQLVRQRDLSARKVQGYVRSKWLVELRLKMRKAATYIQIYFRKFVEQKLIQKSYLVVENKIFYHVNQAEQAALLPSKMSLLSNNISNNTKGGLVTLDAKEARISRDDLMLIDKKISFFVYILDFEILTDTSEIYDPLWNKQYAQLMKDLLANSHDITYIQVGDTHSIVGATNGKLYCWGWDDYGQISADSSTDSGVLCSKRASALSWVEEITRPQVLVLGSNHTFVLDVDNNLYVQGKNNLGQLGLGHNEIVEEPERLDLKINQTDRVKIIKSRGDQSAVVTEKGSVFLWPIQSSPHELVSEPFEIAFPMSKVVISSVSCGINFQIFLAQSGLLFSLGNNSVGELGLGDTKERRVPCLIERLKQSGEKIQSVECGQKHSIAKSGQNKLFTWGYGGKSQLGHGTRQNELFPRPVSLPFPYNKEKVMQAQACARSCIVLLESRKLFWWGSNNTVKQAASPVMVNLGDISSGEMYPARIETTWSRSLSITYLRIADARTLDQATQFKQKLVNTLIAKWTETHLNQIDVPFFESIGKNFSNRHVLKSYSGLRV